MEHFEIWTTLELHTCCINHNNIQLIIIQWRNFVCFAPWSSEISKVFKLVQTDLVIWLHNSPNDEYYMIWLEFIGSTCVYYTMLYLSLLIVYVFQGSSHVSSWITYLIERMSYAYEYTYTTDVHASLHTLTMAIVPIVRITYMLCHIKRYVLNLKF